MKVIIIVAMTPERVIGNKGRLPWRLPADLKHFKATTMDHAVVMGRKTFDSIGKPLPGRRNIVISRDAARASSPTGAPGTGLDFVMSLDSALELCRARGEQNAFVAGGAQIYAQALPRADEMIITHVNLPGVTGDTFFPEWNPSDWVEIDVKEIGDGHRVAHYRRR